MNNMISFDKLGLSFNVSRVAFSVGGIDIYAYGVIIAVGIILALLFGIYEFKRCDLNQDDLFNMFIICIPVAIICARLYYVIFSFDMYRDDLLSVFDIRSGGLAIYGGIIGAVSVILIYCRKKRINLRLILDILAIGLLIGQAIGRWGNFVNGEAYGCETTLPWAMTIVTDGVVTAKNVHPTFLYESLWNVLGFIILFIYRKHKSFNGEVFLGYAVWYGIGRFMIESLRSDSLYIGPIRVSQALALVSVVLGLVGIIAGEIIKRKRKA